jgi:hypothetical protein
MSESKRPISSGIPTSPARLSVERSGKRFDNSYSAGVTPKRNLPCPLI